MGVCICARITQHPCRQTYSRTDIRDHGVFFRHEPVQYVHISLGSDQKFSYFNVVEICHPAIKELPHHCVCGKSCGAVMSKIAWSGRLVELAVVGGKPVLVAPWIFVSGIDVL
jgi:hypothetical protein